MRRFKRKDVGTRGRDQYKKEGRILPFLLPCAPAAWRLCVKFSVHFQRSDRGSSGRGSSEGVHFDRVRSEAAGQILRGLKGVKHQACSQPVTLGQLIDGETGEKGEKNDRDWML